VTASSDVEVAQSGAREGDAERFADSLAAVFAAAALAYIWGYPLVVMERTRRLLVSRGPAPAGMNRFVHGTRLLTHRDREVVRPNNDTLYSSAWLDLRSGPVVLEVPYMGDRYYSFQLMDAYTNSWAYIGRRTTGTGEARFAIAGPGWRAPLPDGLSLLESPTPTVWLLGRTLVQSQEELPAVAELIRRYGLGGLGELADSAAAPAAAGEGGAGPDALLSPQDVASAGVGFFDELGEAMAANPPPFGESALVQRFASAGIGPGLRPSREADPARRHALEQGLLAAEGLLARGRVGDDQVVNGWSYSLELGAYGANYLLRAVVARYGLGALHPEEALYARARTDSAGETLSGARRYVLRFAPGLQPPVDAFWSLTVYGEDGFLVDNPIGRYSIGDRTAGLRLAGDGSLEVLVQRDQPAAGPSNWLPAPPGRFELSLRCYQPRAELLEGRYVFPPVVAVG